MSTRKASEAVIEKGTVILLADTCRDDAESLESIWKPSDGVFRDVLEIRIAPCKEVRSRFSEEVLHAIGDKKSCCK